MQLGKQFWEDENGFIVTTELILIGTLLVIGLIVGLSEIQHAVVAELNDVGEAVGGINQSYRLSGFSAVKRNGFVKTFTVGSRFNDFADDCDRNECALACAPPTKERPKGYGY